MEISKDHEMTPSEVETEDDELQEILERENLNLEKFLEEGITKGVDSLPKEVFDRVQQLFLWRSQSKGSRVKINHEIQGHKGDKSMEYSDIQSPKNLGRKRGRKGHNELLNECGKLMINSCKMRDLTSYSFTYLS